MKQGKILIAMFSAIAISNVAHANSFADHPLYVAADAGIFSASFNQTYYQTQALSIPTDFTGTVQQHGYTGGLAVGFSKLFQQKYLLGVELSGNLDGNNANYTSGSASGSFTDVTQIKHHVDLTFVPGLLLNDTTALYAKLGVSAARVQDQLTSYPFVNYQPVTTQYNSNANATGFAGALGLKKFVTEHFAVFAEGDYHDYGRQSFSDFQFEQNAYTHSAQINSYGVVVGAAYHF